MKVLGIPLPLSKSCRELNKDAIENDLKDAARIVRPRTRVGLRRGMNKTESEFEMILEAQKRAGEILRYEFEGMTLRFANVKYKPDFVVFSERVRHALTGGHSVSQTIKFIEVKGPFIKGNRERAVERFRHAKTYWPEFTFECWQKKDGAWNQII